MRWPDVEWRPGPSTEWRPYDFSISMVEPDPTNPFHVQRVMMLIDGKRLMDSEGREFRRRRA